MILTPGDLAPDFELPQLSPLGGAHRASALREQLPRQWKLARALREGPVLLLFVKESCPTCQFALPFIDRIYRNYTGSKVGLLTIAQEDSSGAAKMVKDLSLQMPVLLDEDPFPVSELYGLSYVPTLFYVGPNGTIEQVVEGFAREEVEEINQKIARASSQSLTPFYQPEEGVPFFQPG